MINPSILKSVGIGGVNRQDDVKTIQSLLNMIPKLLGGPVAALKVDGIAGPKTNGAIYGFQKKQFGVTGADGRVDPGQQTMQKILDLLKNNLGPNPPNPNQFSGFSAEQVKVLQKAVVDARALCENAISLCSLAFAMKEPNKTVTSLRHNFDIDIKAEDPFSFALQSTMLSILQKNLVTLRAGLEKDVPFVFEPTPGFPEAWVVGIEDPTVHIKPGFFDDPSKTDLLRAATILHERAHTVLKAPGHPGINDGGGVTALIVDAHEDKRPYFSNRSRFFEDAIRNAYNYEWLCVSLDSRYQPSLSMNAAPRAAMRMVCGGTRIA